jgi:hypothetical protein
MISGSGVETTLTDSQTLNGHDAIGYLIEPRLEYIVLSGPFLVSRTGDAG